MPKRQPITDAERADHNAKLRAQSAARHAKRQAQWLAALAEAGWTESSYQTAVIRKRVALPMKDSQNG